MDKRTLTLPVVIPGTEDFRNTRPNIRTKDVPMGLTAQKIPNMYFLSDLTLSQICKGEVTFPESDSGWGRSSGKDQPALLLPVWGTIPQDPTLPR